MENKKLHEVTHEEIDEINSCTFNLKTGLIVKHKISKELMYPQNFMTWSDKSDEFKYDFYHLSSDRKYWEDWGDRP